MPAVGTVGNDGITPGGDVKFGFGCTDGILGIGGVEIGKVGTLLKFTVGNPDGIGLSY